MSKLSFMNKVFGIIVAILAAQAVTVLAWNVVNRQPPAAEPEASALPSQEQSSAGEIEVEPISEDAVNILLCGLDDSAGLSDVIMIASFDVKNSAISVLQIPRDTYIGDSYKTGKINQVYFAHKQEDEPVRGLINVIGAQMSLPIDHYIVITLEGFRELVDAMGGITIDVAQRIEFLPDKIIEPGKQHLNGERAEWFVRYRAGYASGDIGRVNAQKLVIDALIQAVHDKGRMGMLQLASQNFSKVDTDLSLMRAMSLASEAFRVEKEKVSVFTLEGTGKMHKGFAVYEADRGKLTELLNLHFRPYGQKVDYIAIPKVPVAEPQAPPAQPPQQDFSQPAAPDEQWEASSEEDANYNNQFGIGDIAGDFPID